jgi:hypothetical protein
MAQTHLATIREVSVTLGGNPSCVMSAVVELTFKDGSAREQVLEFAPDGMLYETWRFMLEAYQRDSKKRHI